VTNGACHLEFVDFSQWSTKSLTTIPCWCTCLTISVTDDSLYKCRYFILETTTSTSTQYAQHGLLQRERNSRGYTLRTVTAMARNWIMCWCLGLLSADAFSGSFGSRKARIETFRQASVEDQLCPWAELETQLGASYDKHLPDSIDSVLNPATPDFSKDHPTLFRERHGWCPYSEHVWLALELARVDICHRGYQRSQRSKLVSLRHTTKLN
jgi:hypothetical protein